MYEGMKEKIKNDIQTAFLNEESLKWVYHQRFDTAVSGRLQGKGGV